LELARLVQVASEVAATSSRTGKVAAIAALLAQTRGRDTALVASYLTGKVPQGRLGIGWRTIESAGGEGPAVGEPPTLADVDETFTALAAEKGKGSAERRLATLRALLARTSPAGRRFLAGLLLGEMRQGALEGVVQDAVSRAAGVSGDVVRQAAMFAGDIGVVAGAALSEGAAGLARFTLRLLSPVAPMLASPAEDVEAAIGRPGEAAYEY